MCSSVPTCYLVLCFNLLTWKMGVCSVGAPFQRHHPRWPMGEEFDRVVVRITMEIECWNEKNAPMVETAVFFLG